MMALKSPEPVTETPFQSIRENGDGQGLRPLLNHSPRPKSGQQERAMNSLNSILIEGTVTSTTGIVVTPKGTPRHAFTVASDRFFKEDNEKRHEVSCFDVETWARLAETCADRIRKGDRVSVVGRLLQQRWTDDVGSAKSRVIVVAEHVEFHPPAAK